MRLLLTSSGLDNKEIQKRFLRLLNVPTKEAKILFIFGARTDKELFYVRESKEELIDLGIKEKNIIDTNINNKISFPEDKFEVIYFCGGNTFYLLDRIKKLDFYNKIKSLINRGIVYIGVSAGSIIAGEDIEIAGWGSEGDKNEVGLKDLSGFGFTDIAVFPHYTDNLKEEFEEFKNKVHYPVRKLQNGEAILINNKRIEKIK